MSAKMSFTPESALPPMPAKMSGWTPFELKLKIFTLTLIFISPAEF
jgi:hypothetical protein